ncbi:Farnesyl pyrophosphate synthase 2, partial [Bienertia sinuspersici]
KLIKQGPSVLESYKLLRDGKEIDENEIILTFALDLCLEWVRMFAAQDGVILRQRIHRVLRMFFRGKNYYVDLLDLIHEVEFQTAYGQMNNLLITIEEEKDLSKYSLDLHRRIVHYKRAKYSFYL